ncbi:MAG: PDGLE domain-containing protein [Candidatus Omnitrophota bacterium]
MKAGEIVIGLFIAFIIAVLVSPFASPWPDGLEKVAEDKGYIEKSEVVPVVAAPVPDYAWPGVRNERLATSLAGVAGTLIVFAAGMGIAFVIRRFSGGRQLTA